MDSPFPINFVGFGYFGDYLKGPRQINRDGRQSVDNVNFDIVLGSASSLGRSNSCENLGGRDRKKSESAFQLFGFSELQLSSASLRVSSTSVHVL